MIFLQIWTIHFAKVTCHNYTQDKISVPSILVIFQMPTQKVFSSVYRLTRWYPVASKLRCRTLRSSSSPTGPHTHVLTQNALKERQNAHALALTKLYTYGRWTVHSPLRFCYNFFFLYDSILTAVCSEFQQQKWDEGLQKQNKSNSNIEKAHCHTA